jgi:hypothetical protein
MVQAPMVQVPPAGLPTSVGPERARRARFVTMGEAVSSSMLPFLAIALPLLGLLVVFSLSASLGMSASLTSLEPGADATSAVQQTAVTFMLLQFATWLSLTFVGVYGVALVAQAKAGSQPSIGSAAAAAGKAMLKFAGIGLVAGLVSLVLGVALAVLSGSLAGVAVAGFVYAAVGMVVMLCCAAVVVDVVNDAAG